MITKKSVVRLVRLHLVSIHHNLEQGEPGLVNFQINELTALTRNLLELDCDSALLIDLHNQIFNSLFKNLSYQSKKEVTKALLSIYDPKKFDDSAL